jgi:hypothetical protein
MKINSDQIIYSEHDEDECFEYKDDRGRVPEGIAVGFLEITPVMKQETLYLFNDIKYSEYDHDYWNNYELEYDSERIVLP